MKTRQSAIFRQPKLKFDPAQFETKQVFYTSKDGTKVPMFLSHKKGVERTGVPAHDLVPERLSHDIRVLQASRS